jgi:hypothetical protein
MPLHLGGDGSFGIRILASGNVGIGTASPQNRFVVSNAGANGLEISGQFTSGTASGAYLASYNRGTSAFTDLIINTGVAHVFKAGGNVGIGTTAPRANLEVVSGSANTDADPSKVLTVVGPNNAMGLESGNLEIATNDAVAADMGGSIAFGARYIGTAQANFAVIKAGLVGSYGGYLSLGTRPDGGSMTERIRITSDGKVGVGMVPVYQLQLSSDSASKPTSSTWTITSDSRVKTNIRPFTDGLDLVHALTPVAYELNGKAGLPAGSTGIGLIAQDVKDIAPYMVGTYKAVLDAPQTTTLLADVSETDTDFTVQDDTLVNTANVKYEVGDEQFTGCVVLPPTTTGQKMIRCGRGPGAKPLSAGNVLTASEAPQDIFNLQASAMPWILVNALKDLEKQTLVPMDVTDVLPACSEQTRGQQKFIGDDLLGDSVKLCGRNAAGAYAWKVTVNF